MKTKNIGKKIEAKSRLFDLVKASKFVRSVQIAPAEYENGDFLYLYKTNRKGMIGFFSYSERYSKYGYTYYKDYWTVTEKDFLEWLEKFNILESAKN